MGNDPALYVDPSGLVSGIFRVHTSKGAKAPWEMSKEWQEGYHRSAGTTVDLASNFIPIVSDGRDAYEVFTGRDFFTGEELTWSEWMLTSVGAAIPVVGGAFIRKVFSNGAEAVGEVAKHVDDTASIGASNIDDAYGGTDEILESICGVNPSGGKMNCVECAIATDACLAGDPRVAGPSGSAGLDQIENELGGVFQPATGPIQIGQSLTDLGDGARGVVAADSFESGNPIGHVFNVVNDNGNIIFLDGQSGGVRPDHFDNFDNFKFLISNPRTPE